MKVATITGLTNTPDFKINKSTQSIVIASSLGIDAIADEVINIQVQKASGNNIIIATKLKLRDFIIGSTYGNEAVGWDGALKMVAICELTDGDGAYPLQDNENFVLSFERLDDTAVYDVYAIDDPLTSFELIKFDTKVLMTDEPSKTLSVVGYDLLIIDNTSNELDYVTLYYSNGSSVQHTVFELRAIQRDVDPVAAIGSDGTVIQDLKRILLPLSAPAVDMHVEKIDFYKGTGGAVPLVFRSTQYQG